MNDAYNIQEATKGFGKKQSRESRILRLLYLSPQPIEQFKSVKKHFTKPPRTRFY
jgi:hypothetical protein